ncbi:hypothetical protein [Nocardia sp. NPDC050435]|uniref:nSTAND1 domain-containing NTPase n=1 Tax=Nocardia sp. NPDC050435 TaxID=3155040 RepID=UPI00340E2B76
MNSIRGTGRLQPSPRTIFAQRFGELFDAAGNPTLRRVAAAAEARMRAARAAGNKGGVSIQRISDWKAGRNVPAKFETLLPVALTLIDEARKSNTPVPPALLSVQEWQRLWTAAIEWDPASAATECPYLGLTAYGPADAELFFGRSRPTAEFVELIRGTVGPEGQGGVVMLVGASGAGKSSLLAAGVIPELAQPEQDWAIATLTPGPDPMRALITAVSAEGTETAVGDAPAQWGRGHRRLLVIDQFEELFTLCADEDQRSQFLTALEDLAIRRDGALTAVVVAVRADFYARCVDFPVLEDALKHRSYLLGPMRLDELAEAITRPAESAGYKLESGLEELVISELCGLGSRGARRAYEPGALPLVSHVMEAVWQRRDGMRLTIDGYEQAGGVLGSVAATAEKAWGELSEFQQAVGKQVLLGLVAVGDDSRDTRRKVGRADLVRQTVEATEAALDVLARTRLITLDTESAYLTHEIVLDAWPRLRSWIDEDRVGYLERQRLHADAADWIANDRDPSLLYRGARLVTMREHAGNGAVGVAAEEFLAASGAARRRAEQRSLVLRSALALLTVVAVVLAAAAFVQNGRATQQRDNAVFAALVAKADRLRDRDPSLSAQLTLIAHRLRPADAEIRARLLDTQTLPLAKSLPAHTESVTALAFRPDRRVLATAGQDRTIRLWDMTNPDRPRASGVIPLDIGVDVDGLYFSPDGRFLAAGGWFAQARLWDVHDPDRPVALAGPLSPGAVLGFDADSRTMVTAKFGSGYTLWDLTEPTKPRPRPMVIPGEVDANTSLDVSPDRKRVAVVNRDLAVEIWDTSDPDAARRLGTIRDDASWAGFSPDGRILAVAGKQVPSIQLWDMSKGALPQPIGQPILVGTGELFAYARAIAFSPDSRRLAVEHGVSASGKLTVLSLADPAHPMVTASWPATGLGGSIDFGPDERLYVAGQDGSVHTWSLPAAPEGTPYVGGFDFDAAGRRLFLRDSTGPVEVWDTTDPAARRRVATAELPGIYGPPIVSPDGRKVLFQLSGGGARMVEVSDSAEIRALGDLPDLSEFENAVFSSDSTRLFSVQRHPSGSPAEHVLETWDLSGGSAPRRLGEAARISELPGLNSFPRTELARVPRRDLVVMAGASGYLGLWDTSDPAALREVGRIPAGLPSARITFVVSPDGRSVATAADGQTIRVWDISDPGAAAELAKPLRGHAALVRSLAFSPDGTSLASVGQDSELRLWDFTDRSAPEPIEYPLASAVVTDETSVAFAPQGGYLVTGYRGIRWWNLDEQQVADRLCADTSPITEAQWREHVAELPYRPPCGRAVDQEGR